jgi:hypothetical protein
MSTPSKHRNTLGGSKGTPPVGERRPSTTSHAMSRSSTKTTGARCKCGYTFSLATPLGRRGFNSFAVVNDRSYSRFFRAEVRVLRASDGPSKARTVASASALVSSLLECPECGRLLLRRPDGASESFYLRDNTVEKVATQPTSWLITHCEKVARPDGGMEISSLPFHLSSSLGKAESFIRKRGRRFARGSWWEIRGFITDCKDELLDDSAQVEDVRYYDRNGRSIARPPG